MSKETWSREAGYIWSMIGSAVGFANVLSFSALCYKNGGGAFLIPYLLAHLLVGIPMLILEGTAGQRTQLPFVSALGASGGSRQGGSWGRLFGWISILTCATIGGFYTVLTGFAVAYTYFMGAGSLPRDTATFFKVEFLKDSGSLQTLGEVAPFIIIATLIVVGVSWLILSRQIHAGVEKICSIFMPLLGVLMLVFAVTTCFLPGAMDGFKRYLIPDFARLSDFALWRDVFGQVFFSLSLGLGIVVGYSRHNPSNFNIRRAMISVALGDFIISLISGLAIFGGIGYMAHKSGLPFDLLVPSDSAFEIGFVIFPMIISSFGPLFSKIIGPLFFACVFIAGITGVFSIIESVAGNIQIDFRKSRKRAVAIAMTITALLALPFCFGNGQHLLGAIAPMVLGNAMLFGGIIECIFFLFISKVIAREIQVNFVLTALKYFVLPLLILSLGVSIFKEVTEPFTFDAYVRFGWLAGVTLIAAYLSFGRKRVSIHTEEMPGEAAEKKEFSKPVV